MTQRIIPISSANFIADSALEDSIDWSKIYGNTNPLSLEIGCGTGHFVVELARQQPQKNFLAIDIYNKGCLKTCAKIDQAGLSNVRVMRVEARWLLTKGLQPGSLSAVYINCPDPWPKKRHRRRRLVNRDFLATLLHFMTPGGDFYFSTDVGNYAEDATVALRELTGYHNVLQEDWAHSLPDYPLSKYMQRFIDLGQHIHFLHHRCAPEAARTDKVADEFQRGFRINWQESGDKQ